MDSEFFRQAFEQQSTALRAAVARTTADTEVPTCPGWDVRKLVRHMSGVYAMMLRALHLPPDAERPEPAEIPEDFTATLSYLEERATELHAELSTMDDDHPVWAFFPGGTPAAWARRAAHETAIHRIDAELAAGEPEPSLTFDPEFAADGIDEFLTRLLPLGDWSGSDHTGRVLFHAADAGRVWLVEYRPGLPPRTGAPADAALEVDATVAGTADAVYRRVWGRPSTAVVTGDPALAAIAAGR